jgi:hypothetical protein
MFKKILWSELLQLDSSQLKLFHRYCKLISNSHINSESRTNLMACIWEEAIEDFHLADCLELIDYFVDSDQLNSDFNKRAYISEYLLEEVEKLIIKSGRKDILTMQSEIALKQNRELYQICIQDLTAQPIKNATKNKMSETISELLTEAIINII